MRGTCCSAGTGPLGSSRRARDDGASRRCLVPAPSPWRSCRGAWVSRGDARFRPLRCGAPVGAGGAPRAEVTVLLMTRCRTHRLAQRYFRQYLGKHRDKAVHGECVGCSSRCRWPCAAPGSMERSPAVLAWRPPDAGPPEAPPRGGTAATDDREMTMIGSSQSPVERAQKQLHRLFPGDPDLAAATAWAAETLRNGSLDPAASPLRSLRALRRADRRLGAAAARYLVEAAAGRSPGPRRRSVPPEVH